jgi:hypothetical protein
MASMGLRSACVLVIVALAIALPACATQKVSLARGPREYIASDYSQVLKRWTRTQSLIVLADLDDKLTVTATFESYDFRWAYTVKYASDYRLTVRQRRTLLDQALKETDESFDFYIALYGTNRRWQDLSRPNSAWIVRLIDDVGTETAPREIKYVDKPGAIERRYFPYSSVWRQVFRIHFPKETPDGRPTISPNARWFGLRFAGAEGNEELRWDLDGSPPGTATAAQTPTLHPGEDFEQGRAGNQ